MRQPQPTADGEEADSTPQIPEVLLLPMAKSIAGVRTPLALSQTNQQKNLVQGIHQAVHRLIHHGGRLGRQSHRELEHGEKRIAGYSAQNSAAGTRGHGEKNPGCKL